MKFGLRKKTKLKEIISSRTSPKRIIQNSLGIKAPRGFGWLTNPKKAAYNRVYNRGSHKGKVLQLSIPRTIIIS